MRARSSVRPRMPVRFTSNSSNSAAGTLLGCFLFCLRLRSESWRDKRATTRAVSLPLTRMWQCAVRARLRPPASVEFCSPHLFHVFGRYPAARLGTEAQLHQAPLVALFYHRDLVAPLHGHVLMTGHLQGRRGGGGARVSAPAHPAARSSRRARVALEAKATAKVPAPRKDKT